MGNSINIASYKNKIRRKLDGKNKKNSIKDWKE
jgi:hypothetical protein